MSKELTDAEVKVLTELSYKKSIKKGNKMTKELEALERLKRGYNPRAEEDLDIVETALKALEIIKEKDVWPAHFKGFRKIETYNDHVWDRGRLTQEEYDLLKEILE